MEDEEKTEEELFSNEICVGEKVEEKSVISETSSHLVVLNGVASNSHIVTTSEPSITTTVIECSSTQLTVNNSLTKPSTPIKRNSLNSFDDDQLKENCYRYGRRARHPSKETDENVNNSKRLKKVRLLEILQH